jgi:hypothetical protein
MQFSIKRRVEAERTALFRVLSDPRYRLDWQSSLRDLRVFTEGAPGVGTRWRETTTGGMAFDLEITTFDPPLRWGEAARGKVADARLLIEFSEVGAATLLEVSVVLSFKGPFRALAPFVRLFMPMVLSKDLVRAGKLARSNERLKRE